MKAVLTFLVPGQTKMKVESWWTRVCVTEFFRLVLLPVGRRQLFRVSTLFAIPGQTRMTADESCYRQKLVFDFPCSIYRSKRGSRLISCPQSSPINSRWLLSKSWTNRSELTDIVQMIRRLPCMCAMGLYMMMVYIINEIRRQLLLCEIVSFVWHHCAKKHVTFDIWIYNLPAISLACSIRAYTTVVYTLYTTTKLHMHDMYIWYLPQSLRAAVFKYILYNKL